MADTFDLSMIVRADGSEAVAAGQQVETALDGVAEANKRADSASKGSTRSVTEADVANKKLAASATALDIAQTKVAASAGKGAEAEQRAALALQNAEARFLGAQRAAQKFSSTIASNEAISNRQAFAMRNAGQQVGDFATQVSLGSGIAQAFAAQAGQMGYALSEFGGTVGKVGAFLTGPYGIALTVATVLAAPFIGKLLEGKDAAESQADALAKAASAADSYGNAQSLLGRIIDLTTGRLKTQNVVLIETIKLQAQANILAAQKARTEGLAGLKSNSEATYGEAFSDAGTIAKAVITDRDFGFTTLLQTALARGGKLRGLTADVKEYKGAAEEFAKVLDDPNASPQAIEAAQAKFGTAVTATMARVSASAKKAGRDVIDTQAQLLKIGTSLTDQAANRLALGVANGGPIPKSLVPYEKPKKPPKPKSTEARDEFGRDAATKIANIVGQFDETPPVLDKTNAKIRELDDLIDDLGRKRPPGFKDLIADAEAAKTVVREGLIREVAKAFDAPKTLGDKAGAALKQLDAVIADLYARKPAGFEELVAKAKEAGDVIRTGLQRPYLDFIRDQEQSLDVQRLIAAGRNDEATALKKIQELQAQGVPLTIAQKDAILATTQAISAQARALQVVRAENEKYVEAVGSVKAIVQDATQDITSLIKAPGRLLDAFKTFQGRKLFDSIFGDVFRELEDQANGTTVVRDASDRMAVAVDRASTSIGKLGAAAEAAAAGVGASTGAAPGGAAGMPTGGSAGPDAVGTGSDIVVTGKRDPITSSIDKLIGKLGINDPKFFGRTIGQNAGKALGGAATGTMVAGVSKALGIKMSGTGAQIGGAVGSFLPIPGGSIIGSIAGGLIGNLFGGKKNYSNATISSGSDGISTVNAGGNFKSATKEANGLADAVRDGVASIAKQLGGALGSYNLSIGTYDGDYRVSTSGQSGELSFGKKNKSKSTLYDFGDDQAGAIAFAIQDAIKDGAVTGLSDAVRRALASSSDVNKALNEALNVKALESALGGLPATLKGIFDAEDAAGKERLRLAKTYGLDIVATEKLNAEQRSKLVDDTLKSRIGSLSDFLDNLKFGDLAEGTAADKRNALLKQIETVQADAEAGKDGAADKLAQLYAQLVQSSRDAYGTAGSEYASDRGSAMSGVDRVIAAEKARVDAAAGITAATQATTAAIDKTTSAITAGNALTDETNDLLAQNTSAVRDLSLLMAERLGTGGGGGGDVSVTTRKPNLL